MPEGQMQPQDGVDVKSLVGKFAPPEESFDLVVVGAGPAGLAAAITAAKAGLSVKLVDENPVSGGLIGMDIPLFYGGRASAAVQEKDRMVERIFAASPGLEEAFELGVDVALGTYAWGAWALQPGLATLPGNVIGLADEERAWLTGFSRLIVAAGARDLVYFFEDADQPGVMGGLALHALLTRYEAFAGERVVIAGSDDFALSLAALLLERGITVAGMVEVAGQPLGDTESIASLKALGVPVYTGHVIKAAGRGAFGVEGVTLAPVAGGPEVQLAADTLCLAVGRIPAIELLESSGVTTAMVGGRGGYVPVSGDGISTSHPAVFMAGDCAGLGAGPVGEEQAAASGEAAARAVLHSLGREGGAVPPPRAGAGPDLIAHRQRWMAALVETGGCNVLACQCEEVSRADLLAVRAPSYLGAPSPQAQKRNLHTLAADGPLNHDQMKRLTRVSMGACQARRCREQVSMLMALGASIPVEKVPLAGYRAPVRPLPLAVLAALEEPAAMRAEWDVWFGIPTQWVPYHAIGTEREAEIIRFAKHM